MKKMIFTFGLIVVLSGALLMLGSLGVTGFAIYELNNIGSSGRVIGIAIVIVGLLIMTSGKSELEEKVEVYDTSHGKRNDILNVYVMIDQYGRRMTLRDFERMIEGFRKEKGGEELVEMAKEEYAGLLLQIAKEGNQEKERIAKSFLEVLGINPESEDYHLADEEKRELVVAFTEWGGSPDTKQREVMRKYNLYYEQGKNHPKIGIIGTGYSHGVPLTPSDVRGSRNMIHEIIKMMEKARKEGKKSD